MNDQEFEIINRETKKQKTIDFVKKNKNIFFVFILSIIFCVIGYFSYEMYLNNKRSNLANKFNNSVNSHKIGNNENIINNMVEIINSNDKTYSPLALYYLIDNNLISSIDEINKYFDIIIYELSLDQNLVDLNIYKKTLYNADSLTENELLNMIEPILTKENLWQSHAMYLLAEYYYSKGEKEKSLNYFKSIVSKTDSNSDIKLEARKRIQRDFSE
tara:strand:- start:286 stop:933 length:648 start_codon:yes stop_codon:yes gene_type:complete